MMRLVRPDSRYEKSFLKAFDEMDNDSDRDAWIYLGPDYEDFFKIPFSDYAARLQRLRYDRI